MDEHENYKMAKTCLCGCGKATKKARFARGCEVRLQYHYIRQEVAANRAWARLQVVEAEAAKTVEFAQAEAAKTIQLAQTEAAKAVQLAQAEAASAAELAQKAEQMAETFGWAKCQLFKQRRACAYNSPIFKVA